MQATVQATVLVCLCGLAAVDAVLRAVALRRPRVPPGSPEPAGRAGGGVLHAVAEAATCLHAGGDPHAAARHLRAALGCAAVALADGGRLLAWDGPGSPHAHPPLVPGEAARRSRAAGDGRAVEVCGDEGCPTRYAVIEPLTGGGTLTAYGPAPVPTPELTAALGDIARLLPTLHPTVPSAVPSIQPPAQPPAPLPIPLPAPLSTPPPTLSPALSPAVSAAVPAPPALQAAVPEASSRPSRTGAAPAAGIAAGDVIPAGVGGVIRFVRRADVRYAEAHGDYARLYTPDGSHLVRVSLSALEEAWGDAGFVRIHRSHLVALAHVEEMVLEAGRCTLRVGGARLTVSRRNTGALRDRLVRDGRPGSQ